MTRGLGSVVASAVTAAPWLAGLSRHKLLVFGATGLLLMLNYRLVVVRPRRCAPGDVCHVDHPAMRWNRRLFWLSVSVYAAALVLTWGSLLALSD